MHHVMELVPYPRIRPISEYQGHFRESEVMAGFAKEYGFSSVEIESFPAAQPQLGADDGRAVAGDARPSRRSCTTSTTSRSRWRPTAQNGDVTGELVDVGLGTRAEDYAGKDVKGKVAIGGGGVAQIFAHGLAARRDRRGRLQHAVSRSRRRRDSLVEHRGQRAGLRLGGVAAPGPRAGRAPRARGEALAPLGDQGRDDARRAGDRARDDRRRPELDAGRHHLRPSLRGLSQAGRERRQLRLRADARGRPRLHQAGRGREAAEAEAHDPLPLGARDQRHQRLAHRAPRHRQARRRRSELRHGRHPARRRRAATGFCSGRPTRSRRSSTTSARA